MANTGFIQVVGPFVYDKTQTKFQQKNLLPEKSDGIYSRVGIQSEPGHQFYLTLFNGVSETNRIIQVGFDGRIELSGINLRALRIMQAEKPSTKIDLVFDYDISKINQSIEMREKEESTWQTLQKSLLNLSIYNE